MNNHAKNLSKTIEGARAEGFTQGYAQAIEDLKAYYVNNSGRTGSGVLYNAIQDLKDLLFHKGEHVI
jgi:hypothetical protein